MKKTTLAASIGAAALLVSHVAVAEPTRGFSQERATVAEAGTVSVDLGYSTANGTGQNGFVGGVRAALGPGELLLNRNDRSQSDHGVSGDTEAVYKFGILPELAVYAGLQFVDDDANNNDYINYIIGAAYTATLEGFTFNLNAEVIFLDEDTPGAMGNDDELYRVGAGVFYALPNTSWSIGAEYNFIDSDDFNDEDSFHIGARWQANERATLDFVVYEDRLDNGRGGFPGRITLNVKF